MVSPSILCKAFSSLERTGAKRLSWRLRSFPPQAVVKLSRERGQAVSATQIGILALFFTWRDPHLGELVAIVKTCMNPGDPEGHLSFRRLVRQLSRSGCSPQPCQTGAQPPDQLGKRDLLQSVLAQEGQPQQRHDEQTVAPQRVANTSTVCE